MVLIWLSCPLTMEWDVTKMKTMQVGVMLFGTTFPANLSWLPHSQHFNSVSALPAGWYWYNLPSQSHVFMSNNQNQNQNIQKSTQSAGRPVDMCLGLLTPDVEIVTKWMLRIPQVGRLWLACILPDIDWILVITVDTYPELVSDRYRDPLKVSMFGWRSPVVM